MNQSTITLAQDLIRKASITPDDNGCQQILAQRLRKIGFDIQWMHSGAVSNLWARIGTESPLLILAGHTDVVPVGELAQWKYPPFAAHIDGDMLFGRGAADMKSSLAAMVCACEHIATNHTLRGSLAFAVTSDEEGDAREGTKVLVDNLLNEGVKADYVLVGEPSSSHSVGDTIRIGRRGSLSVLITMYGKQGHVAYPHTVRNPIHHLAAAVAQLSTQAFDKSNEFPATSFQCVAFHGDSGASNVVAAQAQARCNFRFGNQVDDTWLKKHTHSVLAQSGLKFHCDWNCSAYPFVSRRGSLIATARKVIRKQTGNEPELSTGGGTSDGRFLIRLSDEIIELGPVNSTIHQINEHISVSQLTLLTSIYQQLIAELVCR